MGLRNAFLRLELHSRFFQGGGWGWLGIKSRHVFFAGLLEGGVGLSIGGVFTSVKLVQL